MGSIGSTSAANVTLTNPNNLTQIFNVVCTLANTEYSQALPAKCTGFLLKARTPCKVLLSYAAGMSDYVTLPPGTVYENNKFRTLQVLYFQSDKAGVTIEIVADYTT